MATSRDTTDFILELLDGAGAVSVRAMFGEYALYLDGKVLGLVCDDTLFLKDTPGARTHIADPETGPPYPGAKLHLVASGLLDDPDALRAVVRAIWDDLPVPKPKKPKARKP